MRRLLCGPADRLTCLARSNPAPSLGPEGRGFRRVRGLPEQSPFSNYARFISGIACRGHASFPGSTGCRHTAFSARIQIRPFACFKRAQYEPEHWESSTETAGPGVLRMRKDLDSLALCTATMIRCLHFCRDATQPGSRRRRRSVFRTKKLCLRARTSRPCISAAYAALIGYKGRARVCLDVSVADRDLSISLSACGRAAGSSRQRQAPVKSLRRSPYNAPRRAQSTGARGTVIRAQRRYGEILPLRATDAAFVSPAGCRAHGTAFIPVRRAARG